MNSCNVSVSDRGHSCTRMEQIKRKNVFLVRFLETREQTVASSNKLLSSAPGAHLAGSGGPGGPDPYPFSIQSKLCPQILKPI